MDSNPRTQTSTGEERVVAERSLRIGYRSITHRHCWATVFGHEQTDDFGICRFKPPFVRHLGFDFLKSLPFIAVQFDMDSHVLPRKCHRIPNAKENTLPNPGTPNAHTLPQQMNVTNTKPISLSRSSHPLTPRNRSTITTYSGTSYVFQRLQMTPGGIGVGFPAADRTREFQ